MSIRGIDSETSALDLAQGGTAVREDSEAERTGIGGEGEHGQNSAEHEVESDGAEEEDQAPAAAPPTSAPAASAKKIFGTIRRPNPTAKKGNDTYDYEQKYPEDAPYAETAPNARVWRVHEDESRIHDANMVEESRDNVDVLLVFAGLFSAVVTTFVAQTSQNLQADYAAMSASLLYESVLIQRAIANGSPVNSIAPSPLNPTITFVPATTDVWVNGLWFTSLFISLTTALVAVLVKQWLHHYVALPSGTSRERSLTRQFRYAGFQKWRVQVIIGLLPVLMHIALAIFLVGLVIFLQPLRQSLSWAICAGTALVYTVYVVTAILPILFPQCPYRTPLCDLLYVVFCRIIPQVSWNQDHKEDFHIAYRRRKLRSMFRNLPDVQARDSQSLTMIESRLVQQISTMLAAEALHWLFSVSSNPTVQSIVIQSIGGLPMASEERFLYLQGHDTNIGSLRLSLLRECLLYLNDDDATLSRVVEPAPGMELKLGRLLRSKFPPHPWYHYCAPSDMDFSDLTIAILSCNYSLCDRDTLEPVRSSALFMDIIRSSKLPIRYWYGLMMAEAHVIFGPLDPSQDDHSNMFPLHICSAILEVSVAQAGLVAQDFDLPLVLDFQHALPYLVDKCYEHILNMFSEFVKEPPLCDPSLPQSLRAFVAVIKFILHRFPPFESNMSHTTIFRPLGFAINRISDRPFSSQEATAVITVVEDIIASCVIQQLSIESEWGFVCNVAIDVYQSLTTVAPFSPSLRGLRSMVDFMTIHWDQPGRSDTACRALTDFLAKHIPVVFNAFLENQCLQFFGSHTFDEASVPLVRAYVVGILKMKHKSGRPVDDATLRLHIDYIHNPYNLFTACSILATQGVKNADRTAIHRDITTLVQLSPRDPAWGECRSKLHDLVQSDGGEFFTEQCVWSVTRWKYRPLRTNQIQAEKDNIRYAIQVLDDFFNGRTHTGMGRFLGWCLRQKPGDKLERAQQV